jgi:hypothetical protein
MKQSLLNILLLLALAGCTRTIIVQQHWDGIPHATEMSHHGECENFPDPDPDEWDECGSRA